jgi:hypothetical protein
MEMEPCPECGSTATWLDLDSVLPSCPKGHGQITEEGLLCKTISKLDGSKNYIEIGKEGHVICEGENPSDRMVALLKTILSLETREQSNSGLLDFAHESARKWNRKRAKRRFIRWLRESRNNLPPIPDARLRDLADRLIREARDRTDAGAYYMMEDLDRWSSYGVLQELKEYEIRRDLEPVLLVRSEIPGNVSKSFRQARECYRWGQYAASFGLCRIILDIVVALIDEEKRDSTWPEPMRDEFKPILNCIPSNLLSDREKDWIANFWTRSSNFLHGKGSLPGEDDAWDALQATATILDRLVAREAFE